VIDDAVPYKLNSGASHTLELVANGDVVNLSVNGSLVLTYTYGAVVTGGQFGDDRYEIDDCVEGLSGPNPVIDGLTLCLLVGVRGGDSKGVSGLPRTLRPRRCARSINCL
jgi:hypothetical protein